MKLFALVILLPLFTPTALAQVLPPKDGCRQAIMEMASASNKSAILRNDRAENLIDDPRKMIKNLKDMDKRKLTSGITETIPWSDSYWPLYRGGLGQRYADEKFVSYDWKGAWDYVSSMPIKQMVKSGMMDKLSPAEKFDFMLDLAGEPLTNMSWDQGREYFDESGTVETWMGLCHGWAAAAMMVDEPLKRVQVETSQGEMTLYPSDIKGYVSQLWANGSFETKFIGGRCNSREPRVDERGRPVERDCLDTNPGTWHLTVVNQIGLSKRAFIMDADSDYQVWNHPVFEYKYTYVNPKTKKPVKNLEEAIVERSAWQDPKKNVRAAESVYIVGIKMQLSYAVENYPSTEEMQERESSRAEYIYDLELDGNFQIVGGEWISERHPDFLWVPVKNSFPRSMGDQGQRVAVERIGPEGREIARVNAQSGLPWGPVLRDLVERSKQ